MFWLDENGNGQGRRPQSQAQNVFVTRLHVRYDGERFPDDLVFQETGDRSNFQGRYVLRHGWTGSSDCDQAVTYRQELHKRQLREAQELANLTGWDLAKIYADAGIDPDNAPVGNGGGKWWQQLWR